MGFDHFHKKVQNSFYASISCNGINQFFLADWFNGNGYEINLFSIFINNIFNGYTGLYTGQIYLL